MGNAKRQLRNELHDHLLPFILSACTRLDNLVHPACVALGAFGPIFKTK